MQDVSDKLLGQFVACLEERLGGGSVAAPPAESVAATAEHAAPDPAPAPAPEADAGVASSPPAKADDAINLGSTVLPILVKNYWKQGLAALVVIAVIVVLIAM
jgi:hypothetical protein